MEYKSFNNFLELILACPTDKDLKDFLAFKRWGGKPKCIYCGHDNVWEIKAVPGRYECPKCKKDSSKKNHTFSVIQGTIFEGSNIPLVKWFWCMFEFCIGSNSSNSNADRLTINNKTSWRMDMLLREAVKDEQERILTAKEIEIDELELGAEPWKDLSKYAAKKSGRFTYEEKIKAFGMRERGSAKKASKKNNTKAVSGGYAVIIVVDDKKRETLFPILKKHAPNSETIVFHDGAPAYDTLVEHYPNRQRIDKKKFHKYNWKKYCRWIDKDTGEFVEWDKISNENVMMVTVNSIENCWWHLTLDLFRHFGVSKLHAQKYVNEFLFRYNRRHLSIAEKFQELLDKCLNTPVPESLHKYKLEGGKCKRRKRVPIDAKPNRN